MANTNKNRNKGEDFNDKTENTNLTVIPAESHVEPLYFDDVLSDDEGIF